MFQGHRHRRDGQTPIGGLDVDTSPQGGLPCVDHGARLVTGELRAPHASRQAVRALDVLSHRLEFPKCSCTALQTREAPSHTQPLGPSDGIWVPGFA